jgi:hypothetical protein
LNILWFTGYLWNISCFAVDILNISYFAGDIMKCVGVTGGVFAFIALLGFGIGGIAAGSIAAAMMSLTTWLGFGGGIVALLQSLGQLITYLILT